MIGIESPLRRLPAALDQKQALYFDGMRHAVEIADLAYLRLVTTLAEMASRGELKGVGLMTSAFADSWTFVDALHRFQGLLNCIPGFEDLCGPPLQDAVAWRHLMADLTELRNVADHIGTRVDYVLAKRMPVLGSLTWVTIDPDMRGGKTCVLAPGSFIGERTMKLVNPLGREMSLVRLTGLVHLAAGEHRVCLSDVHNLLEPKVRRLEAALSDQAGDLEKSGSDALVVAKFEFNQPQ
jgi:hypothetical protein